MKKTPESIDLKQNVATRGFFRTEETLRLPYLSSATQTKMFYLVIL